MSNTEYIISVCTQNRIRISAVVLFLSFSSFLYFAISFTAYRGIPKAANSAKYETTDCRNWTKPTPSGCNTREMYGNVITGYNNPTTVLVNEREKLVLMDLAIL